MMFKGLRSLLASVVRAATTSLKNPAQWLVDWARGGAETDSGIAINANTIMRYPPIWYGVNKIAGQIGYLPLIKYVRTDERRKHRDRDHAAYRLLKRRANRYMTACDFKELLQSHALIWGNGRAYIDRQHVRRRIDGRRRTRFEPVQLIPMLPENTKTVIVNGEKWHVVEFVVDTETGRKETRKLRDEDVLHIKGLGADGIVGYSLFDMARNSIGLGLAGEKYANRLYRNQAVPGMLLEAPKGTFKGDEDAQEFLNNFNKWQAGLDNTSKTALLRDGITANKLAMSGRDSQFIEQRRFQRQEAALWLLLESILGDDDSVSYKSLEEKNLNYLASCLNRWIGKWEAESEKLLSEEEQEDEAHYFKFQTAALLRSDFKTTMATLKDGIEAEILSSNDARDVLDMDEREGGDEYRNPNTRSKADAARDDDEDEDDGDELRQRLRGVIESRLQDLMSIEIKRVNAAADKPGFAKWADEFYTRWEEPIASALAKCGCGDEHIATQHCERRRLSLKTAEHVAGHSPEIAGDLPGCVESITAGWMNVDHLVKACISGETSCTGEGQ